MATVEEYLDLIPSEHREKAKFVATVQASVEVFVRIQDLLNSMTTVYDLDTAVGSQLDVIGAWVGFSRYIAVPVPGVFFSWDGAEALGWDFGVWQDASNPTDISVLPDDVYRRFIKAKIAANQWDGTTEGAYAIWDSVFTDSQILIQDYQNMTYAMVFAGAVLDSLTLELLVGGYLPLKPEGVRIVTYFIPVDDGPIFGWDVDSDLIQGWDSGSWARELLPT